MLTHNLDLFPQKLQVKGGVKGDTGRGENSTGKRNVEMNLRAKSKRDTGN